MINEMDQETIAKMKESINVYENKKSSLERLLALNQSLEASLKALTEIDKTWIEKFRSEWWELELTSSLMIDNEVDVLTDEDEDAVNLSIKNMKQLIEQINE